MQQQLNEETAVQAKKMTKQKTQHFTITTFCELQKCPKGRPKTRWKNDVQNDIIWELLIGDK